MEFGIPFFALRGFPCFSWAFFSGCRTRWSAKGVRSLFFVFGMLSVTFRSLFLTRLSLFSSLFCQTPFAGLLLRQGEKLYSTWAAAEGGGQTYRVNLGGVGGKRTAECALQNHFCRPQKLGLVWSVPLSWKGNDRESPKKGGEKRIVGGGSKNVFGQGFFAEFTVCFPTPRVFHPPWPLSDRPVLGRRYVSGPPPRGSYLDAQIAKPQSQRFRIAIKSLDLKSCNRSAKSQPSRL